MKLCRVATRPALLLAAPLIMIASLFELIGTLSSNPMTKDDAYVLGDTIFFRLGYPLTRIVFIFTGQAKLEDSDNWWAIPLLAGLLIIQWIIWGQLAVLIGKTFQSFLRSAPREVLTPHTVSPDYIVRADGRRYRMRTRPCRNLTSSKENM
jgi:hypothetical protein